MSWIQIRPAVRPVPVKMPVKRETIKTGSLTRPYIARYQFEKKIVSYSFPWVSLNIGGPYLHAFFHSRPWTSEIEARTLAHDNSVPVYFCHVICHQGNGAVVCLKNDIEIKYFTAADLFFGTTFTEYTEEYLLDECNVLKYLVVSEISMLNVMKDIKHPNRVLEYDWSKVQI